MGKITVKRFFNKKVKPIEVYDDLELGYPLYYSITYNRKTQHIKSLCGAVMTEKAFNYLEETGEPFNYETNYLITDYKVSLKKELFLITKATEIIVQNEKVENILNEDFVPRLKEYFRDLKESLYYHGWQNYFHNIEPRKKTRKKVYTYNDLVNTKPTKKEIDFLNAYSNIKETDIFFISEQFYYSFNQNNNLLKNLSILQEVLGIDLTKYIYIDTFKIWQIIHLIETVHERNNLIEFALSFDENKYIELNKKVGFNLTDEEITLNANRLKNKVLNSF